MIYGIDPGTTESALVGLVGHEVVHKQLSPNEEILEFLHDNGSVGIGGGGGLLACEMVQSFGMPVGREVFETVLWLGRFIEAWGGRFELIYRSTIKAHLCGSARAKDGNVAQAVRDRYPATGGGARPEVGTKKQPGPLYGFKKDLWQGLAVAIVARETVQR